jgi:CDP-glycerol:poly(glycerophosphate) glycerophosphotransferase
VIGPRSGAALTALLRITPKRRTKIVVHSVPDFEDGALAILDELLARGHKPLVLLEAPLAHDANVSDLAERGVTFAEKTSARGQLHYLTAEIVFTTHGPFRMHAPPGNQKIVYLGHGEPLAKSAGYWIGDNASGATVATASSTIGRAFRCAQHGLRPQQVLLVGAPRNDRLLQSDRETMRQAIADWLPDETSTLFIWLPTFRHSVFGVFDGVAQRTAMPLDLVGLEKVDRWLATHRAAILVKAHPLSCPHPVEAFERIRTIDQTALSAGRLTLCSLLAAADCLITDASSVWVDFLLLDRPVIACFPDLDEYRSTRGLNLEPYDAWFPGPLVSDADELLEQLASVASGGDPYAEKRDWLTRALHVHQDGKAAPRLLDALGL